MSEKEKEEHRGAQTKLKYKHYELFIKNSNLSLVIGKLKEQLTGKEALDVRRFIKTIMSSPDFQSYEELRAEYIKEFIESQNKLDVKLRVPPMANNIPKWRELLEKDAELKIEKCLIYPDKFPTWNNPERNFNGNDMDVCEELFEFVKSK